MVKENLIEYYLMQHLPPLKSLQFFLVAAQSGSFKLAAEKLFVTQAAVSQQIRQLERHLDVTLFERSNRQTRLTAQGQLLLPDIEQGFSLFERGIMKISGDVNPFILRISAVHSFTSLWLLPRLPDYQAMFPDMMVQIAPSNQLVDFHRGDIDLGIRLGKGNYLGLKEKKLHHDQLILVGHPDLVPNADRQQPKRVFSYPWIEDITDDVQPIIQQMCRQYAFQRSLLVPTVRSDNSSLLIEYAAAGRGVSLVNRSLAADHLRKGSLVRLLDFHAPSPHALYLVAPEQHFTWRKVIDFEQWFLPTLAASFAHLEQW